MGGKRQAYVVRIKPSGNDLVEEALREDVLILGWSAIDAPAVLGQKGTETERRERLRKAIQETYGDEMSDEYVAYSTGMLWRFVQEIQEGDYVVVPHGPQFYVAEVTGPALYDASKRENDASHRRPVRWLNDKKPIPRALASARLQARMKARHTIAYAGDLVEDIERVLKDAEEGKSPSLSQDIRQGLKEVVRRELLSGRMNPERFERLVVRLMEGLGATEAWVVPRASDKGADVLAQFTLAGAFDFTVGVQAKYYNRPDPPMGPEAVKQLAQALREGVAQLGLVVTVGKVAPEAYEAAREYLEKEGLEIGIIDGEELVELLVEKQLWDKLDKLDQTND